MKTMTLIAAGALVAVTGVAASQAVGRSGREARATVREPRAGGLDGLDGLAGLSRLGGLDGLRALDGLRGLDGLGGLEALGGLEGLEALRSLEGLRGLASVGAGLGGLEGLRGLEGLSALGATVGASLDGRSGLGARSWRSEGGDVGLGRLERRAAVPPAPWAAADPADSLYRLAREAITRGDYRRAADLFRQVSDRYPRSGYASASLYWRAYSLQRTGRSEDLQTSLDVLTTLGDRDPAYARRGDVATLRTRVCGELARRGDEACAAEIAKAADAGEDGSRAAARGSGRQRSDCPRDDDDDERVAALNALLQMDAERAVPILEKVLARRDECSVVLRRKAVFLLSQKRGAETADALLKVAQSDPDREVREQAVFWLGQTGSDRAVDLLQQILTSTTDEEIKDKAIFSLSQHRSSRAGQILRDVAQRESESEEIRDKAIFWLGQRHSEDNVTFLKGLYGRIKNEALKEKVIFSLSQQRGNERWLMDLATNQGEDIEMRKKALFWAGQQGASVSELVSLWSRMSDREMREQLIFVYSQRRDREAVDKLIDIARTEKDRELRKKAIFWLSQSRDPRVAKVLEDLIGQ